jgi:hypothetical protein
MGGRIAIAFLLLVILTGAVLYMAYKVVPAVRNLSQPDTVNVTYSATGNLIPVPYPQDASGNSMRWAY